MLFGIMLRSELEVTKKTLKTYIMDAWKAAHVAGIAPSHPKENATLTLLNYMEYDSKFKPKPKLEYCGIKWEYIKR